MTIEEFMADKERAKLYRKWCNNDMTLMVCGLLREHFLQPILPGQIGQALNESSASFCLGESAGAHKLFNAIRGLSNISVKPPELPEETYAPAEDEREPQEK